MIYYHGTNVYFKDFMFPEEGCHKDFGVGVYLAESEIHARKTALWKGGNEAYLYAYRVNITEIKKKFRTKEFRSASIEWVKYIVKNRTEGTHGDYALVIGPTADARTQETIEWFIREHKDPCDADYRKLKAILMPVLMNGNSIYGTQICIKSQELLDVFNNSRIKETRLK